MNKTETSEKQSKALTALLTFRKIARSCATARKDTVACILARIQNEQLETR